MSVLPPLVLGAYGPVRHHAANLAVLPLSGLWTPLAVVAVVTVALLLVFSLVTRSLPRAGVCVSVLWLGWLPLRAASEALGATWPAAALPMAVVYSGLLAAFGLWMVRRVSPRDVTALETALGAMGAMLIVVSAVASYGQLSGASWEDAATSLTEGPPLPSRDTPSGRRPDIYFLVLDGYARDDVLRARYGIPSNPLTSYLAQAGFTVTGQSRANYTQTYLSLASTLNMSYLDGLAAPLVSSRDRRPLGHLIQHSAVFSLLKDHGYTTVLVSSDYYATARMPTADHCLCQQFRPTESDAQLLAHTPLGLFPSVVDAGYRAHRHKVEWTFDRLNEPLPGPGPHFVFAHVVAPHPPFVFPESDGRRWTSPFSFSDGNHYRGTRDGYVDGYRRQLLAINERVRHVVEGIKRRSGDEAVIIIQSDHGPGAALDWEDPTRTDLVERTGILSAFHLPGTGDDVLYDWISPVNTFRLVFDEYLGTSYGRLDDRAYFSTWSAPYRFHEVARPGQPGE